MSMILAALLAVPAMASAQDSPAGRWQTVDDDTGKAKSVVEIYRTRDGSYAGKVVEIIDTRNGTDPLCDKCRGSNHNKPIRGMVILWGLKPDGPGKWNGGARSGKRQALQIQDRIAARRQQARHVRLHRLHLPPAGVGPPVAHRNPPLSCTSVLGSLLRMR